MTGWTEAGCVELPKPMGWSLPPVFGRDPEQVSKEGPDHPCGDCQPDGIRMVIRTVLSPGAGYVNICFSLGPLLEIWARSGWLSWPFWAEFHRVLVWLVICQEEWFDCSRVGLIELA